MRHTLIFLIAILCVNTSVAEEGKEIKGYNGLYMGHSFFIPSEKQLEKIILDSIVVGHKQYSVSAADTGGSPGKLWENKNKREEGQRHLDRKKIDLLVMTYYNRNNSSIEHYSKWFDYAIAQNPDTTFMVAIPWATNLHKAGKKRLEELKTKTIRFHTDVVVKLREKYPENKILYCPYGLGTYELIERFWKDKLPGIKYLLNRDSATRKVNKKMKEQLFKDKKSHPGELVAKLGALLWLQTLYNYNLSTLKTQKIEGLPDIDVIEIAETISKEIMPFNSVYEGK